MKELKYYIGFIILESWQKSSNMEEHDVKPAVKIDGNLNPL